MQLGRAFRFNPLWLAIIPLFNVLFLALAFHALSTSFILQPGFQITPPASPFMLRPQRDAVVVGILSGPRPRLFFRDRQCTGDEFEALLAEYPGPARTLVIYADRAAPCELVTATATTAIRLGFSVALATSRPYHAPPR